MKEYSSKLMDHFDNPRNVGTLDEDDPNVGSGLIGSPSCGDVFRLQIKVNPETDVIEDIKFKTFGCGSAIASASLGTEWVKGKKIDDALKVLDVDIAKELQLPPMKLHCSCLVQESIAAAVEDYRKKHEKS